MIAEYLPIRLAKHADHIADEARAVRPPALPTSLPANIAWSVTGNLVYSACQWGMLVGVAKIGDVTTVGVFGLGLAVTAPIFLLTDLQLRPVLVTDIADAHPFSHYFLFRVTSSITAAIIATIAGVVFTGDPRARQTVAALAFAKAVESIDDILVGGFEKYERFDVTGKLRIVKGIGSLPAILAVLYFTNNLALACLAMGSIWALAASGLTLTFLRRLPARLALLRPSPDVTSIARLFRSAAPLGLALGFISFQASLPRLGTC